MTRGQGNSERPEQGAGRFERWRAGWRVALRMARRDVRRHRGRSILITVMVGLPVLLLVAGSTLWFSEDLNTAERLPLQLGQSQGYLVGPQDHQLRQLLDPTMGYGVGSGDAPSPPQPVPGFGPGNEADALGELVGGSVHAITSAGGAVRIDGRLVRVSILGVDATTPEKARLVTPRVSLTSGRWPSRPGEVLVTPVGAASGLPTSGTFQLRTDGSGAEDPHTQTVTVVGTGRGFQTWGGAQVQPVEVITTPFPRSAIEVQWLVERNSPITWPEIEQLNRYGIGVYSRYVILHPETARLPQGYGPPDSTSALYVVGAATLGLLLLTSLLAGPAFAVSAARQRRTLALAASNGATTAQLRRSVLAQALVLGVLSSLLGAAAGLVAGVAGAVIVGAWKPWHFFGPLEVPWAAVTIVAGAGVLSSVIAALIPSRGLARLDIVAVMRGLAVSPRLRRRVPVVGAVLAGIGVAAVLFASFRYENTYFFVFLGGVLLIVVGALLMVPLVLALGARLAQRLPLATRMAAREAGRLRGRATPTVAAIMAGAAVLTTACIALQADTLRQAANYRPTLAPGQALLNGPGGPDTTAELTAAIHQVEPSIQALNLQSLSGDGQSTIALTAVPAGCTLTETIKTNDSSVNTDITISVDQPPRCAALSTAGTLPGSALQAADLDEIASVLDLTPTQRNALANGAIAVLDPDAAKELPRQTQWHNTEAVDVNQLRPVDIPVSDGTVTLSRYRVTPTTPGGGGTVDEQAEDAVRLPVVTIGHSQWVRAIVTWSGGPGALISTQTAEKLHLRASPNATILRGDGPITVEQEQRIADAVTGISADATVHVERGFQRSDALIISIVIAVISLVILVATLIATALGQAEAAPLLGTLAAVGATRGTRRAMAAAQAAYLALLGAFLGLTVGIAPGIAISRLITATYTDNGMDLSTVVIDIPWLQILLPVLLVPLVAAALAWVSIRRAPMVTRRAT